MKANLTITDCNRITRTHRLRSRVCALAGAVALLGFTGADHSMAGELIREIVHFDVSGGEVEGLDVDKSGRYVASTAPLEMTTEVEIDGEIVELEFFESSLTRYYHSIDLPGQLYEGGTVELDGGELTDIALGPHGLFLISNVREDDIFDANQLLVIRGRSIVKRIDLPRAADGLGLSPDGNRLVLAGEKYDAIDIFDTSRLASNVRLLKRIEKAEIEGRFAAKGADLDRLSSGAEPEAVTFTPDGSLAFVSLQESSAVAVLDMATLELVDVVLLPYGYLVNVSDDPDAPEFEKFGVEPDGMGVTPDGNFLLVANESDSPSRHLGGLSVIDLRAGAAAIPEPVVYCIWDLDPSLLDGTGLDACPLPGIGVEPTPEETAAIRALPRIDPNATKTVWRNGSLVTAINIERKTKAQDRGSVLFLDTTGLAAGETPTKLERTLIGVNPNSRPEGLRTSNDGQFFWIGLQLDGGTIARIELNP